ncbi:hypothetical protein SUGI_0754290 [Cryptomeria japonica]|nr:hypothetical protein SUGI_0754290 [Cryptomeria japonica]
MFPVFDATKHSDDEDMDKENKEELNVTSHHLSQDMVGHISARKATSVILEMIKEGKIVGHVVLLASQLGIEKTVIPMGMAKALGKETPFEMMTSRKIFLL